MAKFEKGTLVERIDLTPELAIFRIAPQTSLPFISGQFATLAVEESGRLLQRPYSIVSAPHEPLLEFFIELVPGGLLTPRLWDMKTGDAVLVRNQAAGTFYLDHRSGLARHMMIATVTGVAPFVSMLRAHSFARAGGPGPGLSFLLLQGASYAHEFGPYRDELTDVAREGWLTYVPTVSRPLENPDWAGEVGRVDDLIRKYGSGLGYDYAGSVAYACGHPLMVENARGILGRARFPKTLIHSEKYFTIKKPRPLP
ncbi:MAG TPA: ferredoxin--NADP reductase [Blastocatellia bacterium]|nr:ferredoxin--NADP reductase [Blastocatellia bacterium]